MNMSGRVEYFNAPRGWGRTQPNPFAADGAYGTAWACFEIRDVADDRHYIGREGSGLFCFRAGRNVCHLEARLADFLRYETQHGRHVIVAAPPDIDVDAMATRALRDTPPGSVLRPEDTRWLVHSTPLDRWPAIQASGRLKSTARLRQEGTDTHGIGRRELGEPVDYGDYVALGHTDGVGPEVVVASIERGCLATDEHAPYLPGVRLYFDAHRIIEAGLAVRDGVHTIKVRDELPLHPFVVAAIDAEQADPQGEMLTWTPAKFLTMANARFLSTVDS